MLMMIANVNIYNF